MPFDEQSIQWNVAMTSWKVFFFQAYQNDRFRRVRRHRRRPVSGPVFFGPVRNRTDEPWPCFRCWSRSVRWRPRSGRIRCPSDSPIETRPGKLGSLRFRFCSGSGCGLFLRPAGPRPWTTGSRWPVVGLWPRISTSETRRKLLWSFSSARRRRAARSKRRQRRRRRRRRCCSWRRLTPASQGRTLTALTRATLQLSVAPLSKDTTYLGSTFFVRFCFDVTDTI